MTDSEATRVYSPDGDDITDYSPEDQAYLLSKPPGFWWVAPEREDPRDPIEYAHASTPLPATAHELDAKMAAVDDFHRNMQMELTGNHLRALEQRARMLYELREDCLYGSYGPFAPYR